MYKFADCKIFVYYFPNFLVAFYKISKNNTNLAALPEHTWPTTNNKRCVTTPCFMFSPLEDDIYLPYMAGIGVNKPISSKYC